MEQILQKNHNLLEIIHPTSLRMSGVIAMAMTAEKEPFHLIYKSMKKGIVPEVNNL